MRNGATVGCSSTRSGVPAGRRVPNSGTRAASSEDVIGSGAPPPSANSVIDWLRIPHSVIVPSSWLNADAEMTRPNPYGWPPGVVAPSVG